MFKALNTYAVVSLNGACFFAIRGFRAIKVKLQLSRTYGSPWVA
jgi:hypothetical protein